MTVTPERYSARYLANGEMIPWSKSATEIRSPICIRKPNGTTERVIVGTVPALDSDAAIVALNAAVKAWDGGRGAWPTMRVARRINCMEKFVDALIKVREEVVRLTMWEIAKTRKDAESEFDRTVQYIRDTIEALKDADRTSARFVMEEGFIGQIRRSPLGIVLCMGPFNYPLNETYTTLIPALIMGNVVISKLPRYGALLHFPIFEAMQQAFPPGVVNVVTGDGATVVGPILASGEIHCLGFIGTSRVANILKRQHPRPNRLRCILGLEAKNPAIILEDADLDVAVKECLSGSLSFNGQRCTALKLILAHHNIAQAFVEKLSKAVDALPAGMPWESGVSLTPLPEDNKPAFLQSMVDDAVALGASVVNKGGQTAETFYRPAVVFNVPAKARLFNEEQFGPVVPVSTFREEHEIDSFMRNSPYGQQVSLFGQNPSKIAFLVDALSNQVSRINLNTQCRRGPDTFPFTGRKDSAEGTLSVSDALRAFSIRAMMAMASTEPNKKIVTEIVTGRMSSFLSTDFIF